MQRSPEIVVVDFGLPEVVEVQLRGQIAKLETFFDRIIGCRVKVEGPGRHRRGRYKVRVELKVPGSVIVIDRQSGEDLAEAVDEAFKAAGRRLQDYVRRSYPKVVRSRRAETRPAAHR